MHSHVKQIEMCNACVHLNNARIIKMGFGFRRDLTSEEESNFPYRLENVCFLNICLQFLFFLRHFVFSTSLSFYWFLK